jgi:competence ComEA-like helix-hairpin-helix protein
MRTLAALASLLASSVAFATVNVNIAQQSELQRVKGLDKAKAKSIIEWRAAHGSIDNFTELQQVPGFTPDLVDRLKPQLSFSGDAYVAPTKAAKAAAAAKDRKVAEAASPARVATR